MKSLKNNRRTRKPKPDVGSLLLVALTTGSLALAMIAAAGAATTVSGGVILVNFSVPVDPGSSSLMLRAVNMAVDSHAKAIVIDMNTPGGLLSDMLNIVNLTQRANQSGIPVYTYVPPDSLAASAGSYIAMASNSILMGPGSEIGPSTPIVEGGSALQQNHTEDAMISLMEGLAAKWGRNVTAAFYMVYGDQSFYANQAYSVGIINGLSPSLSQALSTWGLSGLPIVSVSESLYDQTLSVLSNTTVDGILILIGELAIVLDIYHPTIVLSVAGAIAILAGLVGLEVIGASLLGYFLLLLAAVLILLEIKLGHGFAMMAGFGVGVVGILLLTGGLEYSPSPITDLTYVVAGIVVAVGVLGGLYIRWILGPLRSHKKLTGPESLVGKTAIVVTKLSPRGEVRVEGVVWRARVEQGEVPVGTGVIVKSVEELELRVELPPK